MSRRTLVTDATEFLGPAVVDRLLDEGDEVVTTTEPLTSRQAVHDLVAEHGPFEVLVANLAIPVAVAPIDELTDELWRAAFDRLVDPLLWLLAEVTPAMVAAGRGAVVVPTSATALRAAGHPIAAYEVARSAQEALVGAAARELAPKGVRVNSVAPNYVENPTYYPPELVANERFQAAVARDVPLGRLGTAAEAAAMVAWLASDESSFLVGATLPADGGWSAS